MKREHSRCIWCDKPIYMDEKRQTMIQSGKKVDYHDTLGKPCFDEMKHSSGLTYCELNLIHYE